MSGITLFADSLFSKWGFQDGDVIDDVLYRLHREGRSSGYEDIDDHAVLDALVKRRLLPLVRAALAPNAIEYECIVTCHNPCRVFSVGGERVSHFKDSTPKAVENISVDVSDEEILAAVSEAKP